MTSLLNKLIFNYEFKKEKAFLWNSNKQFFEIIRNFKSIPLNLMIGIDRQKSTLLKNTISFAEGNFSNSALLWGSRGNGKSTLIKSVFFELSIKYNNLKLIQINKNDLLNIEKIYKIIVSKKKYRFIIFIDDLSFENLDVNYKTIKSILDGSVVNQPKNSILYITSNRRHLMSREMIENERSSAIHTDESVEEKVSLSDRLGLWIGFHSLSQNDYIEIIKNYCKHYKITLNEKDINNSLKWSLQRGNRTGRSAWQYVIQLASEKNLKINF